MDDQQFVFKVLLSGDSGVGKSSLLMRFTSDLFDDQSVPTIGVDFRTKIVTVGGKRHKLTIWDTAGQERFRTLTSTYYRGAQGVIFVYDVTRSETFESLEAWMHEWENNSTVEATVKMVVGNKVDLESEREVTTAEGEAFARRNGCLFVETSAKMNVAVSQAFEELVLKILDTPELLGAMPAGLKMGTEASRHTSAPLCC